MKSVLISIKPKYCELIANGKKTIEVRKNRPKLDIPFKCYIYCTKHGYSREEAEEIFGCCWNGKVIGEFVCNHTTKIKVLSGGLWTGGLPNGNCCNVIRRSALSPLEIKEYANGKEIVYGWHISDLKIYDEPKELGELIKCRYSFDCCACDYWDSKYLSCDKPIRPPQSWCYVEELV